jgi:outer membrane protein TolC
LRDTVESNVRSAVRSIRSAQLTLDIQRESIRLAERRLELSNELLKGGGARAADSRDVVEAQQSLLTAQDSFEQARASLQVQVLQFLRETGTLRIDPESGVIGRALADAGTNDVAADADEPAAQPVPEILPEVRTEQSSAR